MRVKQALTKHKAVPEAHPICPDVSVKAQANAPDQPQGVSALFKVLEHFSGATENMKDFGVSTRKKPLLSHFQKRTDAMNEHRIAARQRVLKSGKIEFGGGAIDCTVRNISRTGAALDVTTPLGNPGPVHARYQRQPPALSGGLAQGKTHRGDLREKLIPLHLNTSCET